jgi:peptidoglycan/LPS O-acetylase OafA/YrhL
MASEGSTFLKNITRRPSINYRPELDGIRAFAIIWVVSSHLEFNTEGFYGVDVFFVLSGYLITQVLLESQSKSSHFKKFYIGRFARLFPILFIYVLIGWILSSTLLSEWFNISQPLTALFQIKNFYPLAAGNHDVWAHTWSLSAEEQFYVLWPFLLFFFINKMRKHYFLIIIFAYIVLVHKSIFFADLLWLNIFSNPFEYSYAVISVLIRPSEILLGCILALSKSYSRFIIMVIFGVTTFVSFLFGLSEYLFVALVTATLLATLETSNVFATSLRWLLRRQVFVTIGILSYSIYLWHVLIYEIAFTYFGKGALIKFIVIVITLVVSYVSYTTIEIPLQRFINFRFSKYK